MKLPLVLSVVLVLSTGAAEAPESGSVGRWQIVAGEQEVMTDSGQLTTKCFVRLDTATGKAWMLRILATTATGDGLQLDWLPISEYVGFRPRTNPAPSATPPWLTR